MPAALVTSAVLGFGLSAETQAKEEKMPTKEFNKEQTAKEKLYAAMQHAHADHKDTTTYADANGEEVEGEPQQYIKSWAIDPNSSEANQFGIAAVTPDGEILKVGDTDTPFIMTSAIKPFIALLVLATNDEAEIRKHINVEAAGQPFNTKELDGSGRAPNHMINLGAICGSSWIKGNGSEEKVANFMRFFNKFSATGEGFKFDRDVARAAIPGGKPNRTIASILDENGHLNSTPQEALEVYYDLNFIEVDAVDLAVMAATIRNGGVNPVTGADVFEGMGLGEERIVDLIGDLQAMMVTAGMYDAAGKWGQKNGIPAKSCVGGGVFASSPMIADEAFGLGFYGPRLDKQGNSLQAVLATGDIVKEMDWNPNNMGLVQTRKAQLERHAKMSPDGPTLGGAFGS